MTHASLATRRAERITNLDTVRGIATLGILMMNSVSYGLPDAAYFNVGVYGSDTALAHAVGIFGQVFFAQKMMALFSLLFGVGILVFADRAEAKGKHPIGLSLWRNVLLLLIGLVHSSFWIGDILMIYAISSPFILMVRRWSPKVLLTMGVGLVLSAAAVMVAVQPYVPGTEEALGNYWYLTESDPSDLVFVAMVYDFFARSIGMMWVGVALYRLNIVQGTRAAAYYRRMAAWGFGVGLPLAVGGAIYAAMGGYAPTQAMITRVPNTLATIPMAMGYLGVITLWNQRDTSRWLPRLRNVGRMALTNYLSQTAIGLVVLRVVLELGALDRLQLFGFVLAVHALQLVWSTAWLNHFRFGPLEWLWRAGTYRQLQPLRRT